MKNNLPTAFALVFGLLTLVGLLLIPGLAQLILGWAGFLAACALLLGLGNLFLIHSRRAIRANPYSLVLIGAMLAVILVGLADMLSLTEGNTAQQLFLYIQQPLETAFSSLLAFFLLFAGFRLFQQRRDRWAVLFIIIVIILLIPLPPVGENLFNPLRTLISALFVTAGLRGLLIGIALGTITLSLRLLTGSERPYSK